VPHMKLTGVLDVREAWQSPPDYRFSVPEEDLHVKFLDAFLSSSQEVLVFRYFVVEGRLSQQIQVLLARGEEGWILKLDRAFPVLRTPGVKLLLATVAAWAQGRGLRRASSTIEAFEARGKFYADHAPAGTGAGRWAEGAPSAEEPEA
jgi:hypothetical protein